MYAAAAAKSFQSCPTLCDPRDGSPPGSPVPGILQAGTLEWVAISFSNAWKWKVKVKLLSRVWLLATPWTAAYQAPPSMGFSRQEYWSGLPLPSPMRPGSFHFFLGISHHDTKFLSRTTELWEITQTERFVWRRTGVPRNVREVSWNFDPGPSSQEGIWVKDINQHQWSIRTTLLNLISILNS